MPQTKGIFCLFEHNKIKMRNGGIFKKMSSKSMLDLNLGFVFD